jgi:teichuronic acid biosynthesis glycosyltransferase TuaC
MYPSQDAPVNGIFVEQQVRGLQMIGQDVSVLHVNRLRHGALTYYLMGSKLRRAIADYQPDLIHVMYGGVMADQILRHHHVRPTIVTFHGVDLMGERLSWFGRRLLSSYGVYCSRCAAAKADGLVVVARHMIKTLPASINLEKLRVIPCGIDLERFRPMPRDDCRKQLGWDDGCFHVLFVSAAHDPVKRPWLANEAVAHLVKNGIPVKLHYMTGVPNEKVPIWINASDAFLMTSIDEGSPTIVKECLACAVPIVSVEVGDVAERIEGIKNCHLATSDPSDLAMKLRLVFERRQKLDCRNRIEELSYFAVANKLKRFYEETLNRPAVKFRNKGKLSAVDLCAG